MKKLHTLFLVLFVILALPGCSEYETDFKSSSSASQFPSFSYQEETEIWKENEPGVYYDGFKNVTEAELMDADDIIERAKSECTIEYDTATISGYDYAEDIWMVVFSTSGTVGGCQTVYLDGHGVTHLIVYGE